MVNEVVMPRLGWTMEVGRVVEWLKHDGEEVQAGDPIFAVEADKGVTDVEALDSGVLHIPSDSPIGIEVPVGARLAFIAAPGAEAPTNLTGESTTSAATDSASHVAEVVTASVPGRTSRNGSPAISPRARRIADELGVDWEVLIGSGTSGRIREADVRAAATVVPAVRPRAIPAVRRMAEEHGVRLEEIAASSPGGRVTRSDVRAAVRSAPLSSLSGQSMPLSPIRRITSARMAESARTVAPVTLTTEADATELARIRATLKSELDGTGQAVPSFTDMVVRFVALALREHSVLNATFGESELVLHEQINIGVAVDSERGLLAPVVRDADTKSVRAIAEESSRLINQARDGTINIGDLTGGTFTVSNLGMFEIDAFTPIINLPEAAVLGMGRMIARPVVTDEESGAIEVRKMMALSLTFDHRVVDGAPAARFLQRVKHMIERPFSWLMA